MISHCFSEVGGGGGGSGGGSRGGLYILGVGRGRQQIYCLMFLFWGVQFKIIKLYSSRYGHVGSFFTIGKRHWFVM